MPSTDVTIIKLSKTKIVLMILGSLLFVGAGAWLVSHQVRFHGLHPIFSQSMGVICIMFFGMCGISGIRKLFDNEPGLVFSSEGIIDNSSAVSAGMIPWGEIIGAKISEINKQKMLIIKVRNPQKYIERGGILKRAFNRMNQKMSDSPIAIASNALNISFPDLLALFARYLKQYGGIKSE